MKHQSIGILFASIAISMAAAAAADVPAYKVDSKFKQEALQNRPVGIAISAKDQIHVLLADGTVVTTDLSGKDMGGFDAKMQGVPSVIVEDNDKIYLLATETKQQEVVYQGQKRMMDQSVGVKCGVFSVDGKKESEFILPNLLSAKDAHFIDGKLAVGDLQKQQITYFEIKNDEAKMLSEVKGGFRLCCRIFDFCPTSDGKSIFVANLGAFKVQEFSDGKKTGEFGARGNKLEEFQGCCNPVNVAALGNEFVVTVEKAPTRVKICDLKGNNAKIIEGLGELVTGCTVIPVAVDRKGSIYLVSGARKCVVKCVTDDVISGLPNVDEAPKGRLSQLKPKHIELCEARTWENADSGKKIVASMIAFDGMSGASSLEHEGKIRLLIGTKTFELPLDRLSKGDQEFVANLRSKFATDGNQ